MTGAATSFLLALSLSDALLPAGTLLSSSSSGEISIELVECGALDSRACLVVYELRDAVTASNTTRTCITSQAVLRS